MPMFGLEGATFFSQAFSIDGGRGGREGGEQ